MRLLDSENADRDIATAEVTVLTHTPSVGHATLCQGYIALGDGTKNLSGTGGNYQFAIVVGSQVLQPDPVTVAFSTDARSGYRTDPFLVPPNTAVLLKVKSPNAGETDVDTTAYLYDVGPLQPDTLGENYDPRHGLLLLENGTVFAEYNSGADVYFRVFDEAGLVFDFNDKTFKALAGATTPYVVATERTAVGGTGHSAYTAALTLSDFNDTGEAKPLALVAFDAAAPADANVTILPPVNFAVQFGELRSEPLTAQADVSVKSVEGTAAQLKVWLDRRSERIDVGVRGGAVFTADAATDVITSNAHGLNDADKIWVRSTTTLPGGLAARTTYHVRDKTTNTFKLAATAGGSAINITSAGSGTHRWVKPTARLRLREHGAAEGVYLFNETFDVANLKEGAFEKEVSNPNFVTDRQYDVLAEVTENGLTHSTDHAVGVM